ncbi:OLC1v1014830C4 [Oldenlandia corymbosa var. corymbosa]|uniref:OLC1v1014830C4 n=1 Tax=Oldenlandia corymbosa var. corymbosa TaxID=529605 RepID=A0AAV1E1U3_OLDCO|nr:OLC1v1014830C4 [Oldenlandia corymbosa var. corymbosa]
MLLIFQAVKSPSLDYSHFISLPLAVNPQLVDKLYQFQNSILGFSEINQVNILASGSRKEVEVQYGNETTENVVRPELKVGTDKIEVDMKNIPLVSYPPKMSTQYASEPKSLEASELGIDRSIFIKPKTFHLTVLMLKLWNKELVKAAADVLQSISPKVIDALDSRPVSIRLKGLECMKGSFSKARVLYTPVEEIGGEERLICACQVIIDAFVEAGLVLERDAKHKLKLHATVMNVRHRKRKGKKKYNDYFDARSIADRYGSEDWGEYVIQEAHLSERFAFDQNGYYHCCASIPFPESLQLD